MARRARRVSEIAFTEYTLAGKSVLLDTHVWLGYFAPDLYTISENALEAVRDAQREGALLVSDVAAWELALKGGRGSMRDAPPVRGWVEAVRSSPGTRLVPFTLELMLRTAELPSGAPTDPFDRAIIVTAMAVAAPLVTADRRIIDWAEKSRALRVISAR
ncbi:MAG: type II toxin-antitoxin system VapC family toxin [Gemmatimonadaceae bacterium]|nr:type II toxin-antitoxin system VapC family toxin [Gemmatimonadaceae bacterium]